MSILGVVCVCSVRVVVGTLFVNERVMFSAVGSSVIVRVSVHELVKPRRICDVKYWKAKN